MALGAEGVGGGNTGLHTRHLFEHFSMMLCDMGTGYCYVSVHNYRYTFMYL